MQWNEFRSHLRHLSVHQQSGIKEAFDLAKKMHDGQKRRSGEPYFTHPVAVALMLADMGADTDTIMTALLHDTVEDTPLTLDDVKKQFNQNIYTLIEGVTKLSKEDIADRPNLNEQHETLRRIFTLMEKDVRVMVIKIVDRLHNMQTAEFLPPEKQKNLARETIDVYVKIADRLCMQDVRDELEGLCLAILEPDDFLKLSALRGGNEASAHELLGEMRKALKKAHPTLGKDLDLQFEQKSWGNIREQLSAEGAVVTGVTAFTAAFVCDSIDACYRMLGVLHQLWPREALSFQDFINSPAVNGYRGLHTTIILPDGTRVRCKIRTREMHEYARKGVATRCFDRERSDLLTLLPWTQRIAPLAHDTQGRSTEFWETLQSDILGESIVIYGPGDQAMPVPKDSTALDGAFYLLKEEALKLTSIRIAGKEVPYDTRLEPATTLQLTINDEPRVERKWLEWTRTGLATAKIREALSREQPEQRLLIGKTLFQRSMTERKKGFIEEFNDAVFQSGAQGLGFTNSNDAYLAIADGRLDPDDLYRKTFGQTQKKQSAGGKSRLCVIRYALNMQDRILMDKLNIVHKKYGDLLEEIRYHRSRDNGKTPDSVTLHIHIPKGDDAIFMKELVTAGARDVEVMVRTKREIGLMIAVILPWALNPVFAKWLMLNGVQPIPLLTIRFLIFSLFTSALFVTWRMLTRTKFTHIPRLTLLASFPALGSAGNAFFTYFALLFLPPSVHLTVLRFNALLLPGSAVKASGYRIILLFYCLLMASAFLLLLVLGQSFAVGIFLSFMTLLFYTFYSIATERNLHQHRIDMRYPYLLLHMGLLLGAAGLVMAFFQPLSLLWNDMTGAVILYVLLCVCIPHASYSALLKTTRFRHFTDLLLLEVPLSMILEAIILNVVLSPFVYLAVTLALGGLFLLRMQRTPLALEQ